MPEPDPALFPRPRSIDGHDPTVRFAGRVASGLDPSLPAQGYDLQEAAADA